MTIRQNLAINAGETWSLVHTHTVDLTGYGARMTIRRGFGTAAQAFLSTGADADGGLLVLGGAAKTITMSMTDAESGALITGGALVNLIAGEKQEQIEPFIYDLEIESGAGVVTRVLQGKIGIHRNVTT